MAVLLTKTMGQLNEERKPMYPLFEKPSKVVVQSKRELASVLCQTTDPQSILEAIQKNPEVIRSNKSTEPASRVSQAAPLSNLSITVPQTFNAELLEVDPNRNRRKRRKTASPKDKTFEGSGDGPASVVMQRHERRPKNLGSDGTPYSLQLNSAVKQTIHPRPEEEAVNGFDHPGQPFEVPWQASLDLPNHQPWESFPVSKNDATNDISPSTKNQIEPRSTLDTVPVRDANAESHITVAPIVRVESKPKKILRLNSKTGTIGSPPRKKIAVPIDTTSKSRIHSRVKHGRSKIVTIRYGHSKFSTSAIGLEIDRILNCAKNMDHPNQKISPESSKSTKVPNIDIHTGANVASAVPARPPSALHPFFSSKLTLKPSNPKDTLKQSANIVELERPTELTTLGVAEPRTRANPPSSKPTQSAFAGFAGFGKGAKVLKFPGATEPAWPWQGLSHIRGNDRTADNSWPYPNQPLVLRSKVKKSKYQAVEILADEDVIGALVIELGIDQLVKCIKEINLDEYPPLPVCLRAPIKHFETGTHLQQRVRKQLHTRLPITSATDNQGFSEDEIQGNGSSPGRVHPALSKVYTSIATSLSAFDQSQCETQPWIHKYSPKSAAHVLQTGREALMLKEWLQTLTVMAVEKGFSDQPNSRASSVSRRSAASKPDQSVKRKRRSKKLDDFIVSSDEEENGMDEISEPENESSPKGIHGLLKKTVIRAGDAATKGSKDGGRFANAVVVSGPHGCGKTAAVYAVAKELGFEVFEINSSSKRSGKDILEKVGDMTRNHLVQPSHNQQPTEPVDDDTQRIADALADDIKTGRQGTMNSFFKPKERSKPKPKPKSKSKSSKGKAEPIQPSLIHKAPPNQQKQSLILFEEVDILYEEDKQFWATVVTLVLESKRPIIMTCQDESAVPFQSLSLHAILRFTPPPVDLAADYMLLIAANEGHAIQRDAVKALYESRRLDLRASIMELNFWCQFAVGDIKGGLDWFYTRWPIGCDVDKHGNTIRVVSEGTYGTGMGWLSQDFLESHLNYLDIEEETLHEAWDGWHLDVGDWPKSIESGGWANKIKALSTGNVDDQAALSMYGDFAETMSVADLCSCSSFAPDDQILLDFSLPELSGKAREDYVLSHQLLEATPLLKFHTLDSDIYLWMKSRARKYLQVDQHIKHGFEIPTELDRPTEAQIIGLIRNQYVSPRSTITRHDFSLAFDPISEPEKTSLHNTGGLEASAFDGTKTIIATDIAPYVRAIVSYDVRLQQDRARMSNLLSEGGIRGKRMRTTRAAMSALEGGARSTTRRDRYFGPDLNQYFVLNTGMPSWLEAVAAEMARTCFTSRRSSKGNSDTSKMESDSDLNELIESE